jgi:putative transcriptional regulator
MSDTFFSRMKHKFLAGSDAAESFAREVESLARADAGITLSADSGGNILAPQVIDGRTSPQGYLAGQFLVATPLITGSCFHKAVIYVFSHSEDGAMGLILNQSLETVQFSALVESMQLGDANVAREVPVYFGGPVDRNRGFVLHSSEYFQDFSLVRHGDIAVTASSAILRDMIAGRGPQKALLAVGYAGWSAGQLETEIAENSWIHVPASSELVFGTEDDMKWATASKSLGVDMNFYSTAVGHA